MRHVLQAGNAEQVIACHMPVCWLAFYLHHVSAPGPADPYHREVADIVDMISVSYPELFA